MKKIIIVIAVFFSVQIYAQTGIGTTTPDPSAKLEVSSTNKGFLPPRVTLTGYMDNTTIPNPATGLLVYNTGTNVDLAAGYYYWNGASWATIATASSPNQTVDFVSVTRTTAQTVSEGGTILFNQINGGTIPYNTATGLFSLTAGKTYRLTGCVAISSSNASSEELNVQWKNANGDLLANKGEALSTNFATTGFANGIADVIYTPSVNTTVSLTVTYSSSSVVLWGNFTYANIQQIGSSAIINPWVLSGNDVYNTTGKVGIGTSSPATTLDVNGTLSLSNTTTTPSINVKNGDAAATFNDNAQIKMGWAGSPAGTSQYAQFIHTRHNAGPTNNAIDFYLSDGTANNTITNGSTRAMSILSPGDVEIAGKLTIGSASGNVATKASGIVNAGVDVTLGNIKARVSTSGNRSLQLSTVSGTYSVAGSDVHTQNSIGGSTIARGSAVTITTTPTYLAPNYHFTVDGAVDTWNIYDTVSNIAWRITLIIGPSYINNFISIERLH